MKFPQFIVAVLVLLSIAPAAFAQDVTKDLTPYWTSTMDGLFDWYEQGFNLAVPASGLPHPGVVHGSGDPASTILLQPYNQNNVLLLGDGYSTTGRMTLATPTPAKSIAIFDATGNGFDSMSAVVHFSDGSPDVTVNITANDWYTPAIRGVEGGGRIQVVTGTEFETGSVAGNFQVGGGPVIGQDDKVLSLADAHPVASVDFNWTRLYNHPEYPSRTAIFGISTSLTGSSPYIAAPLTADSFNQDVVVEAAAIPEPASMLLLGAPLLLIRRNSTTNAQVTIDP